MPLLSILFPAQGPRNAVRWRLIVGIVVAYLLSAALVIRLYSWRGDTPFVYAAAGVLWAGLLLTSRREWAMLLPLVFAAQLSLDLSVYGASLVEALGYAGSKVAEAGVGVAVFQRLAGRESSTSPLLQLVTFVVIAGLVCPVLFALPPAYLRAEAGLFLPLQWAQWSLVQASGSVIVAPALLALYALAGSGWRVAPRWPEAAVVFLVIVGVSYALFIAVAVQHPASIYLSTPALFWAATRFGVVGAAAGNAVVAIFASAGQVVGSIYFLPTTSPEDIGASLCLFLLVNCAASLLLGASADESTLKTQALARAQDQMRALAINTARKEDDFRLKTAELIHDSMGQTLALGKMKLDVLVANSAGGDRFRGDLRGLTDVFRETIAISRSLTSGVASSVYTGGNLGVAAESLMDALVSEYDIEPVVRYRDVPQLDRQVAASLFRCVRELLVNVIKHAGASKVELDIQHDATRLTIKILDNGVGFDTMALNQTDALKGFGLLSCRTMLRDLGGDVIVRSAPGAGSEVELWVPLPRESRE